MTSTACQPQHLELTVQPSACSVGSPPFFLDAQVEAFDDGGNLASCATNTVTPSIVPGTGDPLAMLGGGGPQAMLGGVATWTSGTALSIDRPGRRYRLQFQAGGLAPVQSRSFTLGSETMQIVGPASVCPSSSGVFSLVPDPGFDSYAWQLDGAPHSYNPTATLSNPPIALGMFHALAASARVDGCVVTPTPPVLSVYFGDLASVALDVLGASSVCVDCIGGSAKAIETGGGTPTRQWGYRTTSGGTIMPLAGETGDTYVLKGANFPGPGTYYVVVTSTPACGTSMVSPEWTVNVVAGSGTGEVLHLAALSRGGPATGESKLLWVNTAAPLEVLIRWNKAPDGTTTCVSPSSPTSPPVGPTVGETSILAPAANAKDSFLHSALVINTAYCYSVFVRTGGGWSPGRTVKARPFDSTTRPGSSVKWAYATGGSAVAPPTVSAPGILAMSNDHTVHALTRGVAGGDWPASWMPSALAGVAHSRSPVVPFTPPLGTSDHVLFAGDDAVTGLVHAIDALTGLSLPGWPDPQGAPVTGAPGGMFVRYGGVRDAIFVGTRTTNAELRALDLATGALLEAYAGAGTPGPIGPINGSPAIDYLTGRLYFASWKQGSGHTLFCLQIQASPPVTPVFAAVPCWSRDLGNITGSPVLVGNRVIVSTDAGVVYSVNATTGDLLDDHTYATLDGPVKGFLFPDRRGDDLIFATNTKVWSLSDVGPTMTVNWTWDVVAGLNPSIVLYRPRSNNVYVGSRNGEIYELDFTSATMVIPPTHRLQVLGGGQGQVGAPSLDISRDLGLPETLIVGSEPGVVYLLELPFPPP
jgi:outer membrane protein assembly factor BamB